MPTVYKDLKRYNCGIVPDTFRGKFRYMVYKYGENGSEAWFNEEIGFVPKTTDYDFKDKYPSFYDTPRDAHKAAIKWLEKKESKEVKEDKDILDIDTELLEYKCAISTESFDGEFKYTVFKFGNNGMSYWFNEEIGFVSKTTVYINKARSWYDSRQNAYKAAIKWLKK